MSVNYHAYQNRGVLFSNHEKDCAQWRARFAGYDPARIAGILRFLADEKYLYLKYFQNSYRLCLADGYLEKETTDGWSRELLFNETMAVYHLLSYTKDCPRISGKWIPSHAVDGVVSRSRTVPDPLLTPFAGRYSGRLIELEKACLAAGGVRCEGGDLTYEFEAFPCVHLRLEFWDADEDFPAQAQILVDERVTDFVHYETIGCITSDLLERLE